jgi:hypothetical protein
MKITLTGLRRGTNVSFIHTTAFCGKGDIGLPQILHPVDDYIYFIGGIPVSIVSQFAFIEIRHYSHTFPHLLLV